MWIRFVFSQEHHFFVSAQFVILLCNTETIPSCFNITLYGFWTLNSLLTAFQPIMYLPPLPNLCFSCLYLGIQLKTQPKSQRCCSMSTWRREQISRVCLLWGKAEHVFVSEVALEKLPSAPLGISLLFTVRVRQLSKLRAFTVPAGQLPKKYLGSRLTFSEWSLMTE